MLFLQCKHTYTHMHMPKSKKEIPQIVSELKAPVRVKQREREQHMNSGKGGGDTRDRQRQHRAQKCALYLTAFVILLCHGIRIYLHVHACARMCLHVRL